jgi:hypothetical protein
MGLLISIGLLLFQWNKKPIISFDALPSHGVKPTWGSHKVKLRKVETW